MGLCINYRGELKNAFALESLIDEVTEIAKAHNWNYFVFEKAFQNNSFSEIVDMDNLFGIMISPPECEPFCYSFLSNGRMCGIMNFNVMQMDKEINDYTYQLATKTQYAGYKIHKELILLTDYINKKYLNNFVCIDEGEYWETRDENLLIETFERFTNFINSFTSSLEMIPINEGEDIKDYLIRIATITDKNKS